MMKIVLDTAIKHPQGADVWVGMWPPTLRQTLKHRFERSNPLYINAHTNISERALGYCRKSLKDVSKTLAEAVPELGKERADATKRLKQHPQMTSPNLRAEGWQYQRINKQ